MDENSFKIAGGIRTTIVKSRKLQRAQNGCRFEAGLANKTTHLLKFLETLLAHSVLFEVAGRRQDHVFDDLFVDIALFGVCQPYSLFMSRCEAQRGEKSRGTSTYHKLVRHVGQPDRI